MLYLIWRPDTSYGYLLRFQQKPDVKGDNRGKGYEPPLSLKGW